MGLWLNETENKHNWMWIFDELKIRGVEALGFLSINGVSVLEEGAKAIFPKVVVQRCIVHLIRNSLRYIPRKCWTVFTQQLEHMYAAVNVAQAREEFEHFPAGMAGLPRRRSVWTSNFSHVEQLYNYGSAVRKVMYTTNAIESVNSSFRKVTKKGAFHDAEAVYKILYLRVLKLYKNLDNYAVQNWALIRNQLLIDEHMGELMQQYDKRC